MFWKFAAAALLCAGHLACASTINFDGGPIYYGFTQTKPLTGQYGTTGVSFSGVNGNGGSILDQGSGFGINAHSGTQFLAFNNVNDNTGTAEAIAFSTTQSAVSIYAGFGAGASYTLIAYYNNLVVDAESIAITGGVYGLLSVSAPQIDRVTVSSTSQYFVLDDLNYTAATPVAVTPEPSSLLLLGTGVLGMAGALRRRFA